MVTQVHRRVIHAFCMYNQTDSSPYILQLWRWRYHFPAKCLHVHTTTWCYNPEDHNLNLYTYSKQLFHMKAYWRLQVLLPPDDRGQAVELAECFLLFLWLDTLWRDWCISRTFVTELFSNILEYIWIGSVNCIYLDEPEVALNMFLIFPSSLL